MCSPNQIKSSVPILGILCILLNQPMKLNLVEESISPSPRLFRNSRQKERSCSTFVYSFTIESGLQAIKSMNSPHGGTCIMCDHVLESSNNMILLFLYFFEWSPGGAQRLPHELFLYSERS
jgi:hypothetical protein